MHPIARVDFFFRCALCDRTLTCTASGYSMAPPLKDGIWLTITPHKAVVETLSTLGLTPHLHRHDDEKNKTPFTCQMLYPVELQAKSLCDPPGRIRTSNPLMSILLIVSLKSSKNNKTHEFVGIEPTRFRF